MKFILDSKSSVFPENSIGSVHASTLVKLADGHFLAAWFCGEKEGANDVDILGSIRDLDGTWSAPAVWGHVADIPHWNPVLFQPDAQGPAYLFFKVGRSCDLWRTYWCNSVDGGHSWTKAVELVPGEDNGFGPVKNKPILLSDGAWLAPNSMENDHWWRCYINRSTDKGLTWQSSRALSVLRHELGDPGIIQPTLWESEPGKVHFLARCSHGIAYRSDSNDGGISWCDPYDSGLPNNNSGLDLDKASDGTLLLAHNPVGNPPGMNWGPRTPLSLTASTDNGKTWTKMYDLENTPGEFSYPAIIALPGNGRHFAGTYTCRRETIVFWEGHLE